MVRATLNAIIDELKPGMCMRDITRYWTFRSTVPGPGLSQASEFLAQRYRECGLETAVLPYPADAQTEYVDGRTNPLAWFPRSAQLEIAAPEPRAGLICSYEDEPLCLIGNSTPTPAGGVEAEVVVVYAADTDGAYEGLDVAGKIVLTDTMSLLAEPQARQRGAVGLVSDCISPPWLVDRFPPPREPEDTPDLTMWATFNGGQSETELWGFSLPARQGRRLRQLIRESGEPVILRATVDADLMEGSSEVVDALLPGTDLAHEEVWVLAHSSEPGAEDNASGCCLSVEVARTLKRLIAARVLPAPRRTIRFLHAVEVQGYLPYLQERQAMLRDVIAGLCVDAVGNDYSTCGGRMVVSNTPEVNASFVDGLLAFLFRKVAEEPNERFTPDTFAGFHWTTGPYCGNDAFVGDGFFDIPTPELSNWPERFYHSSMDTPDKMSPNTLGRVGAVVAAYLYLLATAGPREALWMAGLSAQNAKQRIVEALSDAVMGEDPAPIDERAARLRAVGQHLSLGAGDCLSRVRDLAPGDMALAEAVGRMGDDLARFGAAETETAVALAAALAGGPVPHPPATTPPPAPGGAIYKPLRWEKPDDEDFSRTGRVRLSALRGGNASVDTVWDWINGRRTPVELWERVQFGAAIPFELVQDYLELLTNEGFVAESESGSSSG